LFWRLFFAALATLLGSHRSVLSGMVVRDRGGADTPSRLPLFYG
jgi:hypothetical protein